MTVPDRSHMASPGGRGKSALEAIRHIARTFLEIGRSLRESTPQYQPGGKGVHFVVPDRAAPPVRVSLAAEAQATLAAARRGDQPGRVDVWLTRHRCHDHRGAKQIRRWQVAARHRDARPTLIRTDLR